MLNLSKAVGLILAGTSSSDVSWNIHVPIELLITSNELNAEILLSELYSEHGSYRAPKFR